MRDRRFKMMDAPETQTVGVVLIFSIFVFFTVPFLLRLLSLGLENRPDLCSWFELAFHLLCLVVVVPLMREYLDFSWLTVGTIKEEMITWCAVAVGIMLGYTMLGQVVLSLTGVPEIGWGGEAILPVLTNSLFLTNSYMIHLNPIFATVCAVLIAPLTTCCIFYATAFAKGYNVQPWLGYLLVVLITLFPRLATGGTGWWDLEVEMVQFAVQLPIHLVCCWLYQKLDNIWAPIFAQAVANFIACLVVIAVW